MHLSTWIGVAAFVVGPVTGWGLSNILPAPTGGCPASGNAAIPEPTPPPYLGLELLKKRQVVSFKTCGYISGLSQSPDGCPAAARCVTNTVNHANGCCLSEKPLADCYLATSCIDFASVSYAAPADYSNSYVTMCSSAEAFCVTQIWSIEGDKFTYRGCSTVRTVETVYETYTNTGRGQPSPSPTTSGPTTSPSRSVSSTTSSSATSSDTATVVPGPKSTPTGAIVGGVVGGLAVIAIAATSIAMLILRKKSKDKRNAAAAIPDTAAISDSKMPPGASPPMPQQQYYPPQPGFYPQQGPTYMHPNPAYQYGAGFQEQYPKAGAVSIAEMAASNTTGGTPYMSSQAEGAPVYPQGPGQYQQASIEMPSNNQRNA